MDQILTNFIKYCLGYINISRQQGLRSQQNESVRLREQFFDLGRLLNGEMDNSAAEIVNLENFYAYDPKDVCEELLEKYQEEKETAKKIELVYNKYKNDQYRKQVLLNFGYFEIDLPEEYAQSDEGDVADEERLAIGQNPMFGDASKAKALKNAPAPGKQEKQPLFTVQVRMEKREGRYFVQATDTEIQVNLGPLESVLGEDLYYPLLEELGGYEMEGKLSLPFAQMDVFTEIWHKVKYQLKLKDVVFNEESFALRDVRITVGPKANFFLSEDLRKLTDVSDDFDATSLVSWVKNDELNICDSDASFVSQVYFPFSYDKHQSRILALLKNKAFIVEGPPGTGKSQTISNLLCHLAANGKKVLFVSQKAQALKVVKDRLKSLKVDYLFGYIPNPNSAQLNEIDEMDGVAPQLSAISSYIEKLIHASSCRDSSDMEMIEDVENKFSRLAEEFNFGIDEQRKLYRLKNELETLKEYDMQITDLKRFKESFSRKNWEEIKKIKKQIEELSAILEEYESSLQKKKFDKVFSGMDFMGEKYGRLIDIITDDVAKSGYDRHSKIGRWLNNILRNIRLREIRSNLPREIIDVIDGLLEGDSSKKETVKEFSHLYNYCRYYELKDDLDVHLKTLKRSLAQCGVSGNEFEIIDGKISNTPSFDLEHLKDMIIKTQVVKRELRSLAFKDQNMLSEEMHDMHGSRKSAVAGYLKNIINRNILDKYNQSVSVRQKVKMLAKAFAKSKLAFKTFDKIRNDAGNFNAILDIIPIWIMELDDASRLVPLEAGIFDYVILDEASQCNVAYTLPVMFRSSRAIFVGDSEQMRDNTVMFKANKTFDELARRYQIPEELQIKSTGSSVQSVLDIASLRGFQSRALTYHYRSPKELIGFSNKNFYKPSGKELISLNSNYLTYGDTDRIMLVHKVESDWKEEFSDQANVAEAKAILQLFKEMKTDERYAGKSVGILAFFNAQAICIRELLEKDGFREEKDNYVVSIIDGIQGDEKDIIIYSFVIRSPEQKKMYVPLTGEGGDVQKEVNKGRVNVAFSRAKLQVHCFTSLSAADFPDKIWIKKFLKYAEAEGSVKIRSTELKPFDSYFEEEFYYLTRSKLGDEYVIQNQVESCGFKIDFVITNSETGKRIAVECDGPTHFRNEVDEEYGIYVESDQERQNVLEAAGWKFYRVCYSAWTSEGFDRGSINAEIAELLH